MKKVNTGSGGVNKRKGKKLEIADQKKEKEKKGCC